MGQIRRQTILSSIVIYIGFFIGFVNTYLYVKNGTFTTEEYGLTRLMNDMGQTFFSFASLGVLSYVYKFHPYYKDNLDRKDNDQLGLSLLIVLAGFTAVILASFIFQPLIVKKFSERSSMLVKYYYWILPYALGILLFSLFEAFAWFLKKNVLTNFLKETGLRVLQTVLILLFISGLIDYDQFIKLFSFSFLVIAGVLVFYLLGRQGIHLTFRLSKVTRRYAKKIASLMLLIYSSHIINTLAQYVDSIIIASVSVGGLTDVGVYTLATFIATTVQVPQRSIISATIPVLSNSWKRKNYSEINRIYQRSSINLLIMATLIFFVIWLSIDDMFRVLNIKKDFEAGKMVILIMGISKIIDAGTGVNSQIIGTSNFWRFEVLSGSILLFVFIPLNYLLVKELGINGSALSNLISFAIYNFIRCYFIWKKFKMQPFTLKTLLLLTFSLIAYFICYLLFNHWQGWIAIFVRSSVFTILLITAVYTFKITPDAHQLFSLVIGKVGELKKKRF